MTKVWRKASILLLAFVVTAVFALRPPFVRAQGNTITVNSGTTFQTIQGWEATAFASQQNANFNVYQADLMDKAVNDLGITRVRLEIKSGAENTSGTGSGEAMVNDNNNPFAINAGGFKFTALDDAITKIVVPLRTRLAARGEALYVNLCYVSFNPGAGYVHGNAEEYAEFMEAAFLHISQTFGWVPDGIEVILEADNTQTGWTGARLGNSVVATANRLSSRGWHPEFITPSVTSVGNGVFFLSGALGVPGASNYIKEAAYHRYGGDAALPTFASYAFSKGLRTSQLEWLTATYLTLHDDLTIGSTSAWAEYALAGIGIGNADNGGAYFRIDSTTFAVGWYARGSLFRQYFRYVRPGAVRLGASSNNPALRAVAFRNVNGKAVAIIGTTSAQSFTIAGLPAGTYGVTYTRDPGVFCSYAACAQVVLADVTTGTGGTISTSIPGAGALTVFQQSGTGIPPSAPTNVRITR